MVRGTVEGEGHGIRMMLVRAHGCRICMALDAVEGIFEVDADRHAPAALVQDSNLPLVDWAQVSGVPAEPVESAPGKVQVMVVRTPAGPVGLRIDACLGVRSVSFARTPPMPTRLRDEAGSPLCFLLPFDGRPHLLLEPRGLLARLAGGERPQPSSSVATPADAKTAP